MLINQGCHSGCHFEGSERLMFITHRTSQYTECDEVKMALAGGCTWIQLRMKDSLDIETAKTIKQLCFDQDIFVSLCIDDNVEIALQCKANAVHLGKEDMPVSAARELIFKNNNHEPLLIGATANTFEDIQYAVSEKASYIGLGPFRYTDTKKKLSPVLGLDGYHEIVAKCKEAHYNIPIFAIGGIRLEDVGPLMETGITGIAVSGAIINAPDPVAETRKFLNEINKY